MTASSVTYWHDQSVDLTWRSFSPPDSRTRCKFKLCMFRSVYNHTTSCHGTLVPEEKCIKYICVLRVHVSGYIQNTGCCGGALAIHFARGKRLMARVHWVVSRLTLLDAKESTRGANVPEHQIPLVFTCHTFFISFLFFSSAHVKNKKKNACGLERRVAWRISALVELMISCSHDETSSIGWGQ